MDTEVNNRRMVLALLLIYKGDPLNNSYKLVRIFEHKFRTNPIYILKELREKNCVEYELVNGVHFYNITDLGKKFIKQEYAISLEQLLKEHPNESEIIKSLFHSFDIKDVSD